MYWQFRRYSRSKSKDVRNRVSDVYFALPNFRGRAFQKLYAHYHPCLTARYLEKFPTSHEVIKVHTLNFRPTLKCSRLFFFGGGASPLGCALASLGQSLARVKIWGRLTPLNPKYSLPRCILVGPNSRVILYIVSRPKFTGLFFFKRRRNRSHPRLSDFGYVAYSSFCRYSR